MRQLISTARSATRQAVYLQSSHARIVSRSLYKAQPLFQHPSLRTFCTKQASEPILTRLQRLGLSVASQFQTDTSPAKNDSAAKHNRKPSDEPTLELSRLLEIAKPERRLIGVALAAQLVSASAMMLFPLALGNIVDAVTSTSSAELDKLVLGMGAVFTISSAASALRISAMSLAGSRISRQLRTSLFRAIMRQETEFFDRRQSGELVNRLSSDVPLVSRTLTENLAKIIRTAVTAASSLSLIVYLAPKLSLVTLGSIPPIVFFAVIFGRSARRLSRQLVDALASATQVAAERTSAIKTVRMFGAEKDEARRYEKRVDDTYNLAKRVAIADGLYSGSVQMAAQMSLLGVLWFGGKMVTDPCDPMTIGALTSFSMYAVNLGVSVSGIGTSYGQLTRALGAGHRVFEVIDRKPESNSSTIFDDVVTGQGGSASRKRSRLQRLENEYDGVVSFEDVHFSYPTQPDTIVLRGVDLVIHPGEIVAIAGASGSGKSTLSSLLSKLYTPTNGDIKFGGKSIGDLDTAWLRRQIAVVAQEPILFNGTVMDNIRYGMSENVSREQIENAAKAAASHDMIMSLPDEYETFVGERGASLSGGQRARVSLCRALVRRPRVLVLDEHSAALDAESERAVGQAVNNAVSDLNMAVLTIAHRTSSLRRADRVAVLANGRVIELAPYEELMRSERSHLKQMLNP